MNRYDVLEQLRRAETAIAAYQIAYRDKRTATSFTKHSARVFLRRARSDLLDYKPQVERLSRVPHPKPRASSR